MKNVINVRKTRKRKSKNTKTRKTKSKKWKWYIAASIERQYVDGKVDEELFYRYLKEYARKKQTELEVDRAILCKIDGKPSYRWLSMKEKWLGGDIGEIPCWPTEKEIEEYFPKDGPVKWWTNERWYKHHPIEDTFVKHWEDQVADKAARLLAEENDDEGELDEILKEIEK